MAATDFIAAIRAIAMPARRREDVQRFELRESRQFVCYDPAAMRRHRSTARPGELQRFEQPKILVKGSSSVGHAIERRAIVDAQRAEMDDERTQAGT